MQKHLENCIKKSYRAKNWKIFNKCRKAHSTLVQRIGDSSAYAKNLYYGGSYFDQLPLPDSAYYHYMKSAFIYRKLKDTNNTGKVLLNIAVLEKNRHSYKSSEATSFEALEFILAGKHKSKQVYIYNNLGLVYNNLKDTINGLKYHNKALELKLQGNTEPKSIVASMNNIGKLYRDRKQYDNALAYFKKGLGYDSFLLENPITKAKLLDNYGYTLFLNEEPLAGFNLMNEALRIRAQEEHLDGIVISSIHLANYHAKHNDTLTAIEYAENAKTISRETQNPRDYKEALNILSNLHKEKKSKEYHSKYIYVRDSLDQVDRNQIEQFARIKFEVNEKEEQLLDNKKDIAAKQRIIISLLILVGIVFGIYFQRQWKKRKLTKAFEEGFKSYLTKKYKLTSQNIEFWELWITGMDQTQMSETLFISIDAVKSRRKSLREKIDKIQNIDGNFTQTKAIHIYNLERDVFRNFN